MARFVSHPLGVDLRRVFITFKPASILMTANIRRFTGGVQNGNVGYKGVHGDFFCSGQPERGRARRRNQLPGAK
jgi:hypothetical protein